MGKYEKLKSSLPKFEQEPAYQEKIDTRKAELAIASLPPGELARKFNDVDLELDVLEEQRKNLQMTKTAIEQELLQAFEDDDLSSVKLTDGTLVYQQDDPYPSVRDRGGLMKFIKKEKIEGLMSLPWQTLSSIVKERLMSGQSVPEGVEVFMKSSIRKRKGTQKVK
jgi:hypothetical protein